MQEPFSDEETLPSMVSDTWCFSPKMDNPLIFWIMVWISREIGGSRGKCVLTECSSEDLQEMIRSVCESAITSNHGGFDCEGDLEVGGEIKGRDELL